MGLEEKLSEKNSPFRSKCERIIAGIFSKYQIKFEYEKTQVILGKNCKIIEFHPDFYLPKHRIYLEYFGKYKDETEEHYWKRVRSKEEIYRRNGIRVASIYYSEMWPSGKKGVLRKNFEQFLMYKIFN